MTAESFYNFVPYSRFNLSESMSDIRILVKEFRDRIQNTFRRAESSKSPFPSFAEKRLSLVDLEWLGDNEERFFKDTANIGLIKLDYLSQCGFITCVVYSADGEEIIVGHSSGLIQVAPETHILQKIVLAPINHTQLIFVTMKLSINYKNRVGLNMDVEKEIRHAFIKSIHYTYETEHNPKLWYPMYYSGKLRKVDDGEWVARNYDTFLRGTPNEVSYNRWFNSEVGYITALEFEPNDGAHIIVGHSTGLIQMRHGSTGAVLCTLRNVQFPPKPIYALEYSRKEERICYAACMDGAVYRIEIPQLSASTTDPPQYCIRVDPALESLNMQFYGAPGISSHATPFITQRCPALAFSMFAEQPKMVVGYADTGLRVYDMETGEVDLTYKVHKLRLQFIPRKLRRMHFGQVCAVRCHPVYPYMFASGSWDKTLRIWDIRCKVGCVMTFEGVDICSDSIDLIRNECIAGSWKPMEALTSWDLVAKKRIAIVRVQNRRPDVDGEYIYACRYWHSRNYNRKGKYAIIGGSGTNCVEVINLHNRYITCSYPAAGTVLAITSHQDRIAFGGTATTFNIVKFHDPKHEREKYHKEETPDYVYSRIIFEDDVSEKMETISYTSEKKSVTASTVSRRDVDV